MVVKLFWRLSMYRDEELEVNEEYEDLRKSKHFSPHMTSHYHEMQCPMPYPMPCPMPCPIQMPIMQEPCQPINQCPVCGKSMKWRDVEDFDLEEEDDRYPKSRPYYHHYYKPYYHPYYHPYHKPYHKPYHPYGPWGMKRDFE
jgi:hypothetical protein